MTIVRKQAADKPSMSAEKMARLAALDTVTDECVDYSDIPETFESDWENASSGYIGASKNLDTDVNAWMAAQDSETKRHINDMIRHVMAMQSSHTS